MSIKLKTAKFFLLASAIALSACATGTKMADVPAANSDVPAGNARVVVYRTGLLGAAVQPLVSVDGVERARCQPQGAFVVDVAPGAHTVSATTEVSKTAYLNVEAGQTAYIKCKIGFGLVIGQPSFEVMPEAAGKAESSSLPLIGQF